MKVYQTKYDVATVIIPEKGIVKLKRGVVIDVPVVTAENLIKSGNFEEYKVVKKELPKQELGKTKKPTKGKVKKKI